MSSLHVVSYAFSRVPQECDADLTEDEAAAGGCFCYNCLDYFDEDALLPWDEPNHRLLESEPKVQAALEKAVGSSLGPSLMSKFDAGGPVELLGHVSYVPGQTFPEPDDKVYLVVKGVGTRYEAYEGYGCQNTTTPFGEGVTPLQRWALDKVRRVLMIPTKGPQAQWMMGVSHYADIC
jgi:hypothetical protein